MEENPNTYVIMFLNSVLSAGKPEALLSLLFLFLGRMLPIIALSPFFGARILPHPVKVAFALSLFAVFLPSLLEVTKTPVGFNYLLIVLLVKEFFIGFVMGLIVSIPFMAVQNAGILIDHQRGGASLMVNDPTIQNQASPLGTMYNLVLIWIFFFIDGPFLFIEAIMNSYEVIPPDQFINTLVFTEGSSFWDMQIALLNRMMILSIQLATPALMAIFMTDLFLGITNRLAPQVQITFLGLPLKSLLGLGVVFLGWKLLTTEFAKVALRWIYTTVDMNQLFRIPG